MDKIPLQTLKNVEKATSEEQINNIAIACASVRRNFKPTVRSRREFEPDDSVEFDHEFEKELCKVDHDLEHVYLKETLPKLELELNVWMKDYKDLLEQFSKLQDDNVHDQAFLKVSDERISERLARVAIVENIKKSLLSEVRKLCLYLEKTKAEGESKLKRTTNNFKDITRYLNRGFEAERINHAETVEILRKLEHNLRDTINQCQNAQEFSRVIKQDLKATKLELHRCQRELTEQEKRANRSAVVIRQLEQELEQAQERADFAEKSLNRYRSRF